MKTDKPLTVGEFKRWCEDNCISDNTPLGIYFGDYEKGSVAYGVIADTENELDEKEWEVINRTETTSEHCYCSNILSFPEETGLVQVVVITDGFHIE